jgi:hypothetical protein
MADAFDFEAAYAQAGAWPEPEPLYAEHEKPEPYPLDALPPMLHGAVTAYQAFGRQPVEMVACSALAAASLACQGLVNVSRDGNLIGPCSLSFLNVAVSGERKTACDTRMRRAARGWQDRRRKEQEPAIRAAETRLAIWQGEKDGIAAKIKRLAGSTKPDDELDRDRLKNALAEHEKRRPKVPPWTRLFYEDITPEKLATLLADGWPSGSIWSDEGGLVVGSHAMSEDSALRFLGLVNRLWDGNPFDRDRETRACAHIRGRRLTTALMLQPGALAKLLATGDGIARGIGALARFLICWPTSTIGSRLYQAGDLNAPALLAFDARLHALLDAPLPLDEDGALEPPAIPLSRLAFEVWRRLHDTIEAELSGKGEFALLPDFGAKMADQAARIACIFHVFEHGPTGEIPHPTMHAAARLALWHLNEARRALELVGHSGETGDAQVLLDWLLESIKAPWIGDILRLAPARVRTKDRRDAAIAVLREHGLARPETKDGRQHLVVNPKLRVVKP